MSVYSKKLSKIENVLLAAEKSNEAKKGRPNLQRSVEVKSLDSKTHLVAFDTFCGKLVFVALSTIDIVFLRDKGFGADWVVTCAADETFLVPLSRLVLHFLHT